MISQGSLGWDREMLRLSGCGGGRRDEDAARVPGGFFSRRCSPECVFVVSAVNVVSSMAGFLIAS